MRILFAFGDTGSGFAGGDLLVYRLANRLAEKHSVEFIRLIDWHRILSGDVDLTSIRVPEDKTSFRRRIYEAVNRRKLLRGIGSTMGLTPSQSKVWPLHPAIRVTAYGGGSLSKYEFDHAIATSWMTAYFVAHQITAVKKHYLIQNFEDSRVYSGNLSTLAAQAYTLKLHKIVISDALRSRFEAEPVSLVYPGVDIAKFRPVRPFQERPVHTLILPLKAAPYKGTRDGIMAAEKARRRYSDLRVITFGNKYAAPLAGVSSSDWCQVLHNPATAALASAMNSSRFLLFPSKVEGFPVTPLEAMACGCVVISSPNTGTASYLKDGINGIVAKGFDFDSLYGAIDRAFNLSENLPVILTNSRATPPQFPWERTHEMFNEALGL